MRNRMAVLFIQLIPERFENDSPPDGAVQTNESRSLVCRAQNSFKSPQKALKLHLHLKNKHAPITYLWRIADRRRGEESSTHWLGTTNTRQGRPRVDRPARQV